jgi:hypothetical protein
MKLDIEFPHTDRVLSPNSHAPLTARGAQMHGIIKASTKTKTRNAAYFRALRALATVPQRTFPAAFVEVTWYYKGVQPDVDNVVARLKPLIDGCAMAFGINDRDLELGRVRRVHTLDKKLAGTLVLHLSTETHD